MSDYAAFLATKRKSIKPSGPQTPVKTHPLLHEWQSDVVKWAVKLGRAAIFADCGLGKTFMQLEWARLVTNKPSLIVAPLSVARQTVREATKIGQNIHYIRDSENVESGTYITNYEMLDHVDESLFGAVVLDESSILKNYVGKTRTYIIDKFRGTDYRLACTATPAPNDVAELTNHAEFLGTMTRQDMLGAYFITDMNSKAEGGGYRVKGHAKHPMYEWMASWACAIRKPSDLGYPNDGYDLPGLNIHPEIVDVEIQPEGQLFATELGGVGGRATVRKSTLEARVERAKQLVQATPDQWILWVGLNDEADALEKKIPGSVNVIGAWSPDAKAEALEQFQDNEIRVLITKPSIAGFGMNFQNCNNMAFVGLGDSYESYYQSIRRCYRFGQTREVNVHIILSELEQQIAHNVMRKERVSSESSDLLVKYQTVNNREALLV